ncbi:MAG TPA: glycosyltransferase family 4 protein [Gemmataceae bacterium]|jgi:glycosyltransferase involved in cell wall biosynthesis|nr:glycosyltransferase family 4 protein [Gemmataceae bacterium]
MTEPLRVLLIAEACNPTWTSVPLVGFNLARALAARPDLRITLVTHVRNRAGLTTSDIAQHADVVFIDNEFIAAPIYKLAKLIRGGDQLGWTIDTALAWPSYVVFEHLVWAKLGRRLQRGDFDLIHRITPLSPTAVSPLAAKTPVPMLAGPLNGGLPWPREFPELVRREREWLVPLRNLYKLLPYHRSTYRHLAGVITASRATADEIPRHFHGQRFHLPENGVDPVRFPIADRWPEPAGRFRFVTVGRLVPYKGLSLTLEAMRRSTALRQCELIVIGDGPDGPAHERFVAEHGLQDCVKSLGQVPQPVLAAEMRRSQAFVFPSLREFGGGVILEAMACALPCLIVDYGGPAELVSETTGIKLPMRPREELVESLMLAMERLAGSPDECRRFGATAAAEVRREHTWDAKAEAVAGICRKLLAK